MKTQSRFDKHRSHLSLRYGGSSDLLAVTVTATASLPLPLPAGFSNTTIALMIMTGVQVYFISFTLKLPFLIIEQTFNVTCFWPSPSLLSAEFNTIFGT